MEPQTYRDEVAAGSTLLEAGKDAEALEAFLQIETTLGHKPTSEIMQLMGLCHRKLGNYDAADRVFARAYKLALNKTDKGRIVRDWAMASLARRNYDEAMRRLEESLGLLTQTSPIEYAVTMGFIGRAHAWRGDKQTARRYFTQVDLMLRPPQVPRAYVLNNLLHWMEVESLPKRLQLARRAWPMARVKKNRTWQKRIILLVICRPLAVFLARRR